MHRSLLRSWDRQATYRPAALWQGEAVLQPVVAGVCVHLHLRAVHLRGCISACVHGHSICVAPCREKPFSAAKT